VVPERRVTSEANGEQVRLRAKPRNL